MACTNCDSGGEGCGGGCSCESPLPARIEENGRSGPRLCVKCKERVASLATGNQSEPMCTACLHASLLAKFKTAVNNNGLVLPSDKVLVAFSGGPASRVALEFLKEIRSKAQSDAGAAKDRGLRVFGLGAVFIDERTVLQLAPSDAQSGVDEIRGIFVEGGQDEIPLHIVPLEYLFEKKETNHIKESDSTFSNDLSGKEPVIGDGGQVVAGLFLSVQDATGREDLLEYLRMQAIQKVAQEQGYTKVILGLCTTRIAARIIAATTKGRGYSLSADIQYLDARWPVPVVLPLRDCVARELALFCHFSRFKTSFVKGFTTMADPRSSLNNLAHSFITLLQEENPSREYAIARTGAKLKSFGFNEVVDPSNRRRRNQHHWKKDTSSQSNSNLRLDILCPICSAPVKREDILNIGRASNAPQKPVYETIIVENVPEELLEFRSTCCPSCRFQIFADDEQKASDQYGLLPKTMKERGTSNFLSQQMWMRSQIKSFLLPEEDEIEN